MDQSKKDHLARTNLFYITQVSSMEIKINELKAQNHAKDFEIDYLSSMLTVSQQDSQNFQDHHEINLMLKISQQENDFLKLKLSQIQEVGIIKSKLEQALHMKNLFEQKYRELKTKAILRDSSDELAEEKEELIENLQLEIENCLKVIRRDDQEIKASRDEVEALKLQVSKKNDGIEEMRKKGKNGTFRVYLNKDVARNCYPASNFCRRRPGSSSYSVKVSPDVKAIKTLNVRNSSNFHSPNIGNEGTLRPRIVSISLENTSQQYN